MIMVDIILIGLIGLISISIVIPNMIAIGYFKRAEKLFSQGLTESGEYYYKKGSKYLWYERFLSETAIDRLERKK